MDIIEGNRLIAVFMGAKIEQWYHESKQYEQTGLHAVYPGDKESTYPDNKRHHSIDLLKYHNSWDWLMPVIIKMSQYQFDDPEEERKDYSYPRTFGMISDEGLFMFRYNRGFLHQNENLITAAYEATVEFIQWYNTQTK